MQPYRYLPGAQIYSVKGTDLDVITKNTKCEPEIPVRYIYSRDNLFTNNMQILMDCFYLLRLSHVSQLVCFQRGQL